MSSKLVHLHVHSEYSALDGMGTISELVGRAKELGQTAIALTDHGSMSGLWEFQKECIKQEIKPILGCEFYIDSEIEEKTSSHIIVLARTNEGYSNLCRLHQRSYDNFYKKPKITFRDLAELKEGLIVTTACMGSDFGKFIQRHQTSDAKILLQLYKETFGDDFYVELQPNDIPIQQYVNARLYQLANDLDIKCIVANDVHYVYESDAEAHEVMLGLQTNKKFSDEKRFKFSTNDFWLRSEDEMAKAFDDMKQLQMFKDTFENTFEIAQKCSALIPSGTYHPKYHNVPKGKTERQLLVNNIIAGAKEKGKATSKEYMKSVQHEVDVIDSNGYSGYFLIVDDYIQTAIKNDVLVGSGRGSVGGSKVAYLLGINEIEPEEYGLLFERFLAPGREPD